MDELAKSRMIWRSRRGMLELDLMLAPFVEHEYEDLPTETKQLYLELLKEEDQDLFRWFLKAEAPPQPHLVEIVNLILERHAQRGPAA